MKSCKLCVHYSAQELVRFEFCDCPVPSAYQGCKGIVGVGCDEEFAEK